MVTFRNRMTWIVAATSLLMVGSACRQTKYLKESDGSLPPPIERRVPDDAWDVNYTLMRSGGPIFSIAIAEDYIWPGDVEFEAWVQIDESDWERTDVVLTHEARMGVYTPPRRPFVESGELIELLEFEANELSVLAEAEELDVEMLDMLVSQIEFNQALLGDVWPTPFPTSRPVDPSMVSFKLAPKIEGSVNILDDLIPKQEIAKKFTWGKKINKPGDPCHGKTPEECASEKIDAWIKKICSKPKLKDVCTKLTALKAAAKIKVLCKLDGYAGLYRPDLDTITLNGDYILSSSCGIFVLLHEGKHGADMDAGKSPHGKKGLKLAEERLEAGKKLKEELKKVNSGQTTDLTELKRLIKLVASLDKQIAAIIRKGATERIMSECAAFEYTQTLGAELSDLNKGEGLRWFVEDIGHMIYEMKGLLDKFGKHLGANDKKKLCECLKKMKKRIDDNKLAKLVYHAKSKKYKQLEAMIKSVCP